MADYAEIPGVYSERPRPLIGLRRCLRTYKTAIALFIMMVFVIALASGISILISGAMVGDTGDAAPDPTTPQPANQSLVHLLAITWPRRDEHWYEKRWNSTMTPESPRMTTTLPRLPTNAPRLIPTDPDSPEWTRPDGSTFPDNDTWHWNRHPDTLPDRTIGQVSAALAMGTRAQEEKETLEEYMSTNNLTLKRGTANYRHQQGFRKTLPMAVQMSKLGFAMDEAAVRIKESLNLPRSTMTFDSRWLADLTLTPHCDPAYLRSHPAPCPPTRAKYRTMDGSCNNVFNPMWGASFTAFRRMLPPDYSDGVRSPRRGQDHQDLPSARQVSLGVHVNKRVASRSYSVLAMSWGQFVDHDITLTALSKGVGGTSITCCAPEVQGNTTLQHPECLPIHIPEADPVYSVNNNSCMEFIRSAPAPRCKFGAREQLNQQTSFLDGSAVYGASAEATTELRNMTDGLLNAQVTIDGRQLLPASLDPLDGCNQEAKTKYKQYCFKAGDPRVNEQILLTSLHTVMARQHNIIAIELKDLNAGWEDEMLFQEARRIVVAQLQHVTYQEYVPSVLGPRFMQHLGLSPQTDGQHTTDYDVHLSPAIANEFAAAAFRFGHSQIQGLVQQIDGPGKNIDFKQLSSITFNPFSLYVDGAMAGYVRGETSQKAAAVDTYFSPQVTGQLFRGKEATGLDLVSINIQRGRDHGVPAYTRARMACGLPSVKNFTDLAKDMDRGALKKIEAVYSHVDDIDLYTGGLAERPIQDGLVGPTFACIIADQFLRLKKGDRYWYETDEKPQAFSKEQLAVIHKTSLARILCDNIPELASIQRWPLRVFSTANPRLPCSSFSIPKIYLDPWDESTGF